MTGCSVTDLDHIFSLCLKREILVKACYTVSLCFWDPQFPRNIGQKLRRQITIFLLDPLDNRDQGFFFTAILCNDLVCLLIIRCIYIVPLLLCISRIINYTWENVLCIVLIDIFLTKFSISITNYLNKKKEAPEFTLRLLFKFIDFTDVILCPGSPGSFPGSRTVFQYNRRFFLLRTSYSDPCFHNLGTPRSVFRTLPLWWPFHHRNHSIRSNRSWYLTLRTWYCYK